MSFYQKPPFCFHVFAEECKMDAQKTENLVRWIDLSSYGIYIGVHTFESGRSKVVMIDETGRYEWLAKKLRLQNSKIPGVWFWPHEGKSFSIPAEVNMKAHFPKMRLGRIPTDVRDDIMRKRLKGMAAKMSMRQKEERVPGWNPGSLVNSSEQKTTTMSADVAIRRTLYCGINAQGEEVIEDGDGLRFIRADGKVVHREQEKPGGVAFLRAKGIDDEEGLLECARGIVIEMQRSKLRSEDFSRYINAVLGSDSDKNEEAILAFQKAIDTAVQETVSKEFAQEGIESAFRMAEVLHQMRPAFYRPEGSFPTPVSISVAVQHLMLARMRSDDALGEPVMDLNGGTPINQHTWMFDQAMQSSLKPGAHRYFIGGLYSKEIDPVEHEGMVISRADHLQAIENLAKRTDEGASVFIMAADEKAGEAVNMETRRLIDWIGQRYQIVDLVDLDATMVGEGVQKGTRILVVGPKKAELDLSFSAPIKIRRLFGGDDLWDWSSSIAAEGFRDMEHFGDIRQANHLQVPYSPHSMIGESTSMAPRNLLAPMRKALSALADRVGMNIDDYVSQKLEIEKEQLPKFFKAEQIDAIALGIDSIDNKTSMVVADQAGLGKGRVLAALAAYSVKSGYKTMFMTEKPGLYADFYRDVHNIGMENVLNNPVLLNTSGAVRTMDGKAILHPPSSEAVVKSICQSGKFPENSNFMMSTYSMFNRDPATEDDIETLKMMEEAEEAILKGAAFDDIPHVFWLFRLGNPGSAYRRHFDGLDHDEFMVKLNEIAHYTMPEDLQFRKYSEDMVSIARAELRYRSMSPSQLIKKMEEIHHKPLNSWRGYWISSPNALDDVVMLMDESHNAAGKTSKIGEIMRNNTRRARSCIFSSATFSKDEDNLPLYAPIFPSTVDTNDISSIIKNGGEPMREILTSMLAEDGLMIRREHDVGNIEFKPVIDEKRRARNIERKDAIAKVLFEMSKMATLVRNEAKKRSEALKNEESRFTTSYSGPFSRFYAVARVLSAALNVSHVAELAIEQLKNNQKPVITTESTMESVLRELAEDGKRDEEGRIWLKEPANFKVLLHRYLGNMFNVYEVARKGRKVSQRRKIDVMTPELQAGINEIKQMIDALPNDMTISPIDEVRERIEAAGFTFAELSGRKIRLSTAADGRQYIEQMEDQKEGAGARIVSGFNSGESDVLLISNSGSTGISVHADGNFADTRQRVLNELQPASDIRKRAQIYFRVFRSGQVCPPQYVLPMLGLNHEKRLRMIQNNASRRMSSSVSGNADNILVDHDVPEIMNSVGDDVCREWLENRPEIAELMNIPIKYDEHKEEIVDTTINTENASCGTTFVDRLTGRLFMLSSEEESRAWDEIHGEYLSKMEQYRIQGYNPLESSKKDIRAKTVASAVLFQGDESGNAFEKSVMANQVTYTENLPAMDPQEIQDSIKKSMDRYEKLSEDGNTAEMFSRKIKEISRERLEKLANDGDFISVEAALASTTNNRVKNFNSKVQALRNAIRTLDKPGNCVYINTEQHVIMDIIPPKNDKSYPMMSSWKIKMLDVNRHQIIELRLSSFEKKLIGSYSKNEFKRAMKRVSEHEVVSRDRVMLEGNLFEASRICNRMKSGEVVSYTNDRGLWKHAFMMPEDMTLKDVMRMPIEINNGKEAYEAMIQSLKNNNSNADKLIYITNDFHYENQVYMVGVNDDMSISIDINKAPSKEFRRHRLVMIKDEILSQLADETPEKRSKNQSFRIPQHNAAEAIDRLIALSKELGVQSITSSHHRDVFDEIRKKAIEEKRAQSSSEKAKSMASQLGL